MLKQSSLSLLRGAFVTLSPLYWITPATAAIQPQFDRFQSRADAVATALGWSPSLSVIPVEPGDPRDGMVIDGALYLSAAVIGIGVTDEERDALVTILGTRLSGPDPRTSDVGAQLAAVAIAGAVTAIDPPDLRDPSQRYKPYLGTPRQNPVADGREEMLAARIIADVEHIGGCTGPLATVLRRLGATPTVPGNLRARGGALIRGAGSAFYPPDFRCVAP